MSNFIALVEVLTGYFKKFILAYLRKTNRNTGSLYVCVLM